MKNSNLKTKKQKEKQYNNLVIEYRKEKNHQTRAAKNQKLRDQKIYTLGGEIFSSVTHGITTLVCVAILVLCIVFAAVFEMGALAIVSICIYGAMVTLGFAVSTVYHALAINSGKRVMRVLDHCSIYFIIAGTYTPYSLIALAGALGWVIFGINWGLCIIGATLTAINREKFKKFAFTCYLCMGWLAIVVIVPIIKNIGWGWSLWLLIGGGVAYTIGAIVFKMKGKYVHGIWHLFTLIGLVLHFFSILFLIVF